MTTRRQRERTAFNDLIPRNALEAMDFLRDRIITRNTMNIMSSVSATINADEEVIQKRGRKKMPKMHQTPIRRSPRKLNHASFNQLNANQLNANQLNSNQLNANQLNSNQLNANQSNANQSNAHQSNSSQLNAIELNSNETQSESTPNQTHDYFLRSPNKWQNSQSSGSASSHLMSSPLRSFASTPTRVSPRKRLVLNSNDSGISMTPTNDSSMTPSTSKSSDSKPLTQTKRTLLTRRRRRRYF